jgi:hypothetical protein
MLNFGTIKNKVSRMLGEAYLSADSTQAENVYREYMKTVKSSPVLMLEYIVFKNLEKRDVANKSAHHFIDENVALFKRFKKSEIVAEHQKLKPFNIAGPKADETKRELNESIQNLILENAQTDRVPNINKIHDAVTIVLESITTPSVKKAQSDLPKYSLKTIAAALKTKLAESYNQLNEGEKNVLSVLLEKDTKKQEKLFTDLKQKGVAFINESNIDENTRQQAITEINSLEFKAETLAENVFKLYELTA